MPKITAFFSKRGGGDKGTTSKKRQLTPDDPASPNKRLRSSGDGDSAEVSRSTSVSQLTSNDEDSVEVLRSSNPKRIICWNCNGLSVRLRYEAQSESLKSFLREQRPDVFFISEVRLPAAHNAGKGKPTPTTKFFRGRIRHSDTASSKDFSAVQEFLASDACADYKAYFSLANTKYAGTAMLVNKHTTALPSNVRYNLDLPKVDKNLHDTDGRVIYAKFPGFSILHTYVPNNGWDQDHFERRQKWDEAMKAFMKRKKDAGVKVLWIGDLNVAPEDNDLSHPVFFRSQDPPKDKRKRDADGELVPLDPEYFGQPGCTDAERRRFGEVLEEGGLVDVFRKQHPNSDDVFTWSGNALGKMGGMSMRIDHCIASATLADHIGPVDVLEQSYMGSDHCPVSVQYREHSTPPVINLDVERGKSKSHDNKTTASDVAVIDEPANANTSTDEITANVNSIGSAPPSQNETNPTPSTTAPAGEENPENKTTAKVDEASAK